MLETPNCHDDRVFPVWFMPVGDDHKRKPFHIVHCMAQPPCDETLRISPGKHSRLPPECVAKFAAQKGWLADRKGYALCPLHKPGGVGRPPSDMPPSQKRAAFLAIRDRNLAAAAERMLKPSKPVGALAKHTAKVRAATEAATATAPGAIAAPDDFSPLERRMLAFIADHPNRIWSTRREAAKAGGFNIWTFNTAVGDAIDGGFLVQEPVAGRQFRPFRFRLVDQFDPPAMQPEPQEESAMTSDVAFARPSAAEPPRQPTREWNRTIRDFLETNFDDIAGNWFGDWSDAKAAEKLGVPRAWVATIRESFYGPDISVASINATAQASELETALIELKDDALGIATRAEALEREVRQFLGGRRP